MNVDDITKFEHPFINRGRKCDRCGAEFKKLTFKCPFCGKLLLKETK